ncbi:MAG TPA: TIR domain-containing protein [Candidatus Didemnitutus sp.]|nr:TIR domain-containing protein [Candidatus Didemnitutus sp.]
MSETSRPAGAVFLSYAREDADAARRIADALRGFGVEVWFDLSELRGGDSWDAKIRRQIRECTLFIPIISARTQVRREGYFRREWNLAVERTLDMSAATAFIVPVLVDDTREGEADVPEQFLKAHFTRLVDGAPTPQFVEQVTRLLREPHTASGHRSGSRPAMTTSPIPPARSGFPVWAAALLGVAVIALGLLLIFRSSGKPGPAPVNSAAGAPKPIEAVAAPDAPDAKSIAVLPFVNMSADADQGFFADGLAEELLNLLAKIPALHVTSRSSAFSFKGKNVEIPEIARQLHVAHVLEGSVRKSGNKLRITAQLIDARTDTHLWSETYDRSLDDIFAVQDEIAAAVTAQLKVTLLGAAPKAKAMDPKAYALCLQARQLFYQNTVESLAQAVALFRQALAIDSSAAAAWGGLADCYILQAISGALTTEESFRMSRDAVEKALALDPDLASAHATLGILATTQNHDLAEAARHYERALALDPTNSDILSKVASYLRSLNRTEQCIAVGEFLTSHDPVNSVGFAALGGAYTRAGRIDDGIAATRTALRLSPGRAQSHYGIGIALLHRGDAKAALAEIQQEPSESWRLDGLATVYHALGRKKESDAALEELIRKYERDESWNIAYICAYRGEIDQAFAWLDKAIEYHDSGLSLSPTAWQFESLHQDPRWMAFLRKIGEAPEQLAAIKFEVNLPTK